MKGGGWETALDTEQFRNVQESERYVTHVSGTKLEFLSATFVTES